MKRRKEVYFWNARNEKKNIRCVLNVSQTGMDMMIWNCAFCWVLNKTWNIIDSEYKINKDCNVKYDLIYSLGVLILFYVPPPFFDRHFKMYKCILKTKSFMHASIKSPIKHICVWRTPAAASCQRTYQKFRAQGTVQLGRGTEVSSFLHLFLDEPPVGRRVIFTQIIQHRPKLVNLP